MNEIFYSEGNLKYHDSIHVILFDSIQNLLEQGKW
jgi:hypothetical protein